MTNPAVFSAWDEDLIQHFRNLLMERDLQIKQFLSTNGSIPWKEVLRLVLLEDLRHISENREWLVKEVLTVQQRIDYGI